MPCCGGKSSSKRSKSAGKPAKGKAPTPNPYPNPNPNLKPELKPGATFHSSAIVRKPSGAQYQPAPAPLPAPLPLLAPIPSPRPSPRPEPVVNIAHLAEAVPTDRCQVHYNTDYLQLVGSSTHSSSHHYLPELEGDVEALSLIDLDRHGLSGKIYFRMFFFIFKF